MRNLKRVLSLTLASVMLLGMMVIGSSAAEGYTDVDAEAHNIEAIDVLQKVNVMNGYAEDGDFHPDDSVTRAQMARIMAELLKLDYDYYEATTSPFSDVGGASAWAKKYIDACAANGIVVGRGGTIFDPQANVTAVEASSMLMRALGYFKYSNDYSDGFELSTVSQGTKIGIYKGVGSNANEPMTRNQVAQMVLNTLESGLVQPDGNTINLTTPDGSILTGKVNYVYVTSSQNLAVAIHTTRATSMGSTNDGAIVELGEQLYDGKLKLSDKWVDDFGRPSRHWEYDGASIGTYIKKDLLRETYTKKVTGRDLYTLLGSEVIKDYKFTITIDGETEPEVLNAVGLGEKNQYYFTTSAMNHTNTNQVGGTGNGVLTQVFVNGIDKEVHIAIINTYLVKADGDYNSRKDEATFTIYEIKKISTGELVKLDENSEGLQRVSGGDFDVADVKDGDIFLVHVAKGEIKEFLDPEIIDDATVTAFKDNSYVVTGGEQINYANTIMYDVDTLQDYVQENMKNATYRIYLDEYGYVIGIKQIDSEKQYVFLTGINSYTENLKDQTAIGNVIFLDGTSKNITINMKDSKNAGYYNGAAWEAGRSFNSGTNSYRNDYNIRYDTKVSSLMNTWCTYSVDENGVYTLTEVPNTPEAYRDSSYKHGQSHTSGTYSADGINGVYYTNNDTDPNTSRKPAIVGAQKVTAGTWNNNGMNEKFVEIDKGHVSLDGIPDTAWRKVYGNSESIYLSAETELLTTARNTLSTTIDNGALSATVKESTQPAIIITGADSVSVGVQDVKLQAYNAQAVVNSKTEYHTAPALNNLYYMDVSEGVYTLFDKNGYVIAAVVVGAEDSNYTWAWVSSTNLSREALVDGKWEYSRDVIIDGKEATLTEIETSGSNPPTIQTPSKNASDRIGFWWAVKTKGDGTVNEADQLKWDQVDPKGINHYTTNVDYVYDINAIDADKSTVILNQSFNMTKYYTDVDPANVGDLSNVWTTDTAEPNPLNPAVGVNYKVRVTGNTLQVEGATGNIRGFAVNPSATIAVVKDEQIYRDSRPISQWNYKTDIEYFTNDANATGLKQAVSYLNESDDFMGYIAAVIKDGRAESVIIYDKSITDINIGTVAAGNSVYVNNDDTYADGLHLLAHYKTGAVPAGNTISAAVVKYLTESRGINVETVQYTVSYYSPTYGEALVTYTNGGVRMTERYYVTLVNDLV